MDVCLCNLGMFSNLSETQGKEGINETEKFKKY